MRIPSACDRTQNPFNEGSTLRRQNQRWRIRHHDVVLQKRTFELNVSDTITLTGGAEFFSLPLLNQLVLTTHSSLKKDWLTIE